MELKAMYPAANSRYTQLTRDITEDQDVIPVSDVSVFPPAPNYAAVETWDDQEVVLCRGIDPEEGTLLDCVRGVSDTTAKPWLAGADVLHVIASDNLNNIMDNVKQLAQESGGLDALQRQVDSLEESKADKTDLTALQGTVDGKADKTALDAKANKTTEVSATLTAAGWSGSGPYTQTVTVSGLAANATALLDLAATATAEQATAFAEAVIYSTAQAANSVTLQAAGDKPELNIPVKFAILG